MMHFKNDYEYEVKGSKNLALLAGSIMIKDYNKDYEIEEKEDSATPEASIITEVDAKIDSLIQFYFSRIWPDDSLLTEETKAAQDWHKARRIWIVDPIDGTMGYKKQTGSFGISIALIEDGRPVLGILYAPALKLMAIGVKGEGSYLNNKSIDLSSAYSLNNIICSSNAYQREPYQKALSQLNPDHKLGLITMESVVVKAIRLLQKKGEIYPVLPLSDEVKSVPKFWDIAAADILIHEAGGVVTDFSGQKYKYDQPDFRCKNGVIMGTQKGHQYAIDKMKSKL
jgi:myo-inositol-1(or 4)-monophosphatase